MGFDLTLFSNAKLTDTNTEHLRPVITTARMAALDHVFMQRTFLTSLDERIPLWLTGGTVVRTLIGASLAGVDADVLVRAADYGRAVLALEANGWTCVRRRNRDGSVEVNCTTTIDMGQFLPLDREEAHRVIQAVIKGEPVETYHSHFVPHAVRLLVCPKPVAAADALLRFFAYAHLPPALQARSKPFHDLALKLVYGPQNDETIAALRKLLEAKDCAVRAWL